MGQDPPSSLYLVGHQTRQLDYPSSFPENLMAKDIIVIGSGFGGLSVAIRLEMNLKSIVGWFDGLLVPPAVLMLHNSN